MSSYNHFILDEHTESCVRSSNEMSNSENSWMRRYSDVCSKNPNYLLFMALNQYWIIEYYSCRSIYGHLDFKEGIIKQFYTEIKKAPFHNIERRNLSDDLLELRRRSILLKKRVPQINYLYSDSAGKDYCIFTTVDYLDAIISSDDLDSSYNQMMNYIKASDKLKHLKDNLWYLHSKNNLSCDDYQVVKTVDELIKQINKQTNGNN